MPRPKPKPVQTDPETGQQYIIKSDGSRQRIPVQPRVWRPKFLAALADSGNVRYACEEAGVARQVVYRAKHEDQAFAEQWRLAIEDACDLLEAVARDRAIRTSDRLLMFLLAAHRPDVYGKAAAAAAGSSVDQTQVHIYVPDNGRGDAGAPRLEEAQVIDLPRQPVEPVEPVEPLMVDETGQRGEILPTDSEKLAWLKQQPWFHTRGGGR